MTVLITGGTGLVGKELTRKLKEKGYDVSFLSRSKKPVPGVSVYVWDPETGKIELEAITTADYIVHLAGENIMKKRWTQKQKKLIIDSRVKSAELLFEEVKKSGKSIKAFISASAIGYYGALTSEKIFEEENTPGNDFVAEVCWKWELAADKFKDAGIRTVKVRTSPVMAKEGGMLDQLLTPVKMGIGSAMGDGAQYFPWIHIEDLCGIYVKTIEDDQMSGAYNAAAPGHVTNKQFMKTLASTLKKPFWFPNIPAFVLKLVFGEMGKVALKGSRISSQKIQNAGYKFKFPELIGALKNILEGK